MKKLLLAILVTQSFFAMDEPDACSAQGKEIEIKFQVSEIPYAPHLKSFVADVRKNGIPKGCVSQTDRYLSRHRYKATGKCVDPLETLRIREEFDENDSPVAAYLTRKARAIDLAGRTISVEEDESLVSNASSLLRIFEKEGYSTRVLISKKRERFEYSYQGHTFEIAFDDIELAGAKKKFYEVELKSAVQTVEQGKCLIYALLLKFGLTQIKQYDRGYLHMALNPNEAFYQYQRLGD